MTLSIKNPVGLDPIAKNRLHEEIVRQIQRKILSGDLPEGDKLPPERELAASLQVNRATVREALKKLEILGLIEIRHGDGIYIKNYLESGNLELFKAIVSMDPGSNIEVLRSLLEIRRILVPVMAGRAAALRSEAQVRELDSLTADAAMTLLERDLAIHHVIARASGNILYIFILNFFNQLFEDWGYLYFDDPAGVERSQRFHADIVAAIGARDSTRAIRVTEEVLHFTEAVIFQRLNINQ